MQVCYLNNANRFAPFLLLLKAMIDQNGDKCIEYEEFISTAQACLADESRGKRAPEVTDALSLVQSSVQRNKVRVAELGQWLMRVKGKEHGVSFLVRREAGKVERGALEGDAC